MDRRSVRNLSISIQQGPAEATPRARTATGTELSIGRAPENDWVLPDPDRVLSKRHCMLGFRAERWHLADLSSNGTFLNDAAEPLGQGRIAALNDGDRLRLGPYVMAIRIGAAQARPEPPPDATLTEAAKPPAGGELAAFLRGAGLTQPPAHPEACLERAGQTLRIATEGLRRTLAARGAVKGEFRIEQTMVRARGNNPLKFAVSDDDALASLILGERRSDLPAPAAFAEALRDIRLHELATMAAMQTAIRALLRRLDPQPLREEGERSGGMLPAQRRARAFELFEKRHAELTAGLADDFDAVFGHSFAEAYEQALADAASAEPK